MGIQRTDLEFHQEGCPDQVPGFISRSPVVFPEPSVPAVSVYLRVLYNPGDSISWLYGNHRVQPLSVLRFSPLDDVLGDHRQVLGADPF